jgi:hypothetical protein
MTIETCTVDEAASATSTLIGGLTDLIVQGGSAVSSVLLAVVTTVATTGTGTTTLTDTIERQVTETVVATSSLHSLLEADAVLTTSAQAASLALVDSSVVVEDEVTATDTAFPEPTGTLDSAAAATSTVLPHTVVARTLATGASAVSSLHGFNDVLAASTASADDEVVLTSDASLLAAASADATSSVALVNETQEVVGAGAVATSAAPTVMNGSALLESVATVADALLVPTPMAAWVMNTETAAMTRYEGLPVESIARVGGVLFGLGAEGLYRFAGDDDAGTAITSTVTTGRLDFKSAAIKRLGDMVISYSSNGTMTMEVSVYGSTDESRGQFSYQMPQRDADSARANRFKVGKGLASKFWRFSWSSLDGSRFKVSGGTVDVMPSTNRRT